MFGWLWREINEVEDATKAVLYAYIATVIIVVFKVAVVFSKLSDISVFYSSLNSLLDAAVYLFMGIAVKKFSRVAAVAVLLFFLYDRLVIASDLNFLQMTVATVVSMIFINAIKGTFYYHKSISSQVSFKNSVIKSVVGVIASVALSFTFVMVVDMKQELQSIPIEILGLITTLLIITPFGAAYLGWLPFTRGREMSFVD